MRQNPPNPPPATTVRIALDDHQTKTVALLARRLGGSPDEVLEYLATVGLFALGLDGSAYTRVDDGVARIFGEGTVATEIMGFLADCENEACNVAGSAIARLERPRMFGDWRGERKPVQAEA